MNQLRPAGPPVVDLDHVETVEIPRPTMPEAPHLRHSAQRLSLSPADRLTAPPEGLPVPSLHFDEGHEGTAAHHQVQLVAAHPEPMGLDPPAGIAEVEDGEFFSLKAETVAGIGPVIGWDGSGG